MSRGQQIESRLFKTTFHRIGIAYKGLWFVIMDTELLIALCVLWMSTTVALVSFLSMWFLNNGEAFHPHSVDVDRRHRLFLVVSSKTECKTDCAVKSISEFAAPRGSSSSKNFASLIVMIAVAGFLGTSRWYAVGDAAMLEAVCSFIGFGSLLLVAAFEIDVEPERYLDQKLLVTGWLIKKLGLRHHLNFTLQPHDNRFLEFIRQSHLYHLYGEDKYMKYKPSKSHVWRYHPMWNSLHMIGAIGFVFFVTAAILINDHAEEKVAWITGFSFTIFGLLGYLTGSYLPVIRPFRCWIITWNPFVEDQQFMFHLIEAIREYKYREENGGESPPKEIPTAKPLLTDSPSSGKSSSRRSRKKSVSASFKLITPILPDIKEPDDALQYLDIWPLQMARKHPKRYLMVVGRILVMSELIALMTPAVAMGIQWITATCHDIPPVYALIGLIQSACSCLFYRDCKIFDNHCTVT